MRVLLAVIGFASALVAPPWVPAICVVLLAVRYRAWEAIVLGLLVDLTWQPLGLAGGIFHTLPLFTLFCIIVVWVFEPVRSQLLR